MKHIQKHEFWTNTLDFLHTLRFSLRYTVNHSMLVKYKRVSTLTIGAKWRKKNEEDDFEAGLEWKMQTKWHKECNFF